MVDVVIVAATAQRRASLRAGAEGPGIAVVAERAQLIDPGPLPDADVIVVDGTRGFAHALDVAGDSGDVAVVGVIDEAGEAASLVRDADVRGWALVTPAVSADELRAAITAAAAGLGAWPASWSAHLTDREDSDAPLDVGEGGASPSDRLTIREQEVLELLAEGLSNRRIAERLGMSEHTAKFHVAAIYSKLDVSGRAAAVSRALRKGLIKI